MSFTIQKKGNELILAGVLDENADLAPVRTASGEVVIHFKGVTRINSCGVRDWVQALAQAKPTSLVYRECPMPIVKQLNAVPAFLAGAKIESIYAPYFCEACDKDQLCLLPAEQFSAAAPPAIACDSCQKPMKFDAIPAQYLGFAKRLKP